MTRCDCGKRARACHCASRLLLERGSRTGQTLTTALNDTCCRSSTRFAESGSLGDFRSAMELKSLCLEKNKNLFEQAGSTYPEDLKR